MLKIKRQIRNIYAITTFTGFQIAGASWVALLSARGFSLVEIGIMESMFHVVSLLFEIPSGAISDVFGRKKSMIMSLYMFILSSLLMIFSRSFMGAAVSVMISALGYNFASGTREALAYDSLKRVGKEEDYQKFASTDMMIYRVGSAAATLCAGFALFIGYKTANAIDMVLGIIGLYFAYRLVEIPAVTADSQTTYESESPARHTLSRPDCQDKEQQNLHLGTPGSKQFFKQLWLCLKNSFSFLAHSPKTRALLLVNSLIGAIATLMIFFLQAQLPLAGIPDGLLGPALFLMGLGGAFGAKAVEHFSGKRYRTLAILSLGGVVLGTLTMVTGKPWMMCLGGFAASFFDDFIEVRSDVLLNEQIPSSERATLISISSLCFSLVMIFLSPMMGYLFALLQ